MVKDTNVDWTYEVPGKPLMAFVKEMNVSVCDARFDLLENGIEVRAVDPSHVMMSRVVIGEGEPTGQSYGMELSNIKAALTGHTKMNSKETSMVTLSLDEGKNTMSMDLQNGTVYQWKGLDLATLSVPSLPDLSWDATIKVPSVKLALGVQSQRRIGDLANLVIRKDELEMSTTTGTWANVEVVIPGESTMSIRGTGKEEVKSSFSLTYLLPMLKAWKNVGTVELNCGDNYPLEAKKTQEMGGVKLESSFFLAPRIENDY